MNHNREASMTSYQADVLINTLKNLVNSNKDIYIPLAGKKELIEAISVFENEVFTNSMFRGRHEPSKLSLHAMYNSTNTPLLRLDINAGIHTNPDGEKIEGSHLHLYKDGFEIQYAIPFDVTSDDLVAATKGFMVRFNVIDVKDVIYQDGLFS